jgi:hypothetical protein
MIDRAADDSPRVFASEEKVSPSDENGVDARGT